MLIIYDSLMLKKHCSVIVDIPHSQLTANFYSFKVVNLWSRLPCGVISTLGEHL